MHTKLPVGERFYQRCCISKRFVNAVVIISEVGHAIQYHGPQFPLTAAQRRKIGRAIKRVTRELTLK